MDLLRQLEFLLEIDQLKNTQRTTVIPSGLRLENSAEHSWHLAVAVITLHELAGKPLDTTKLLKLAIIHDLVEVYAGDTNIFLNDTSQATREQAAAEKLFALLPATQAEHFHAIWHEFETKSSEEAKFVKAIDAFLPAWLHAKNITNETPITEEQLLKLKEPHLAAYPALWAYFQNTVIPQAVTRGWLI